MRNTNIVLSVLFAALLGCSPPDDAPPAINPDNLGVKGPEEAFVHEEPVGDVFADGRQLPPAEAQRLHACGKVRYSVLGRVLQTRGVNLMNPAADSAGALYRGGNLALGAPNYDARAGEPDRNTTGGITRLFDILIAAADEMITNMPNMAACRVDGVGARLFEMSGCSADGFACLLGMPVSPAQLALCNDMLLRARGEGIADDAARRLAVAAVAAPVFLCD
jgi:hypothetical protein